MYPAWRIAWLTHCSSISQSNADRRSPSSNPGSAVLHVLPFEAKILGFLKITSFSICVLHQNCKSQSNLSVSLAQCRGKLEADLKHLVCSLWCRAVIRTVVPQSTVDTSNSTWQLVKCKSLGFPGSDCQKPERRPSNMHCNTSSRQFWQNVKFQEHTCHLLLIMVRTG